ncbi:MAG: hypothetical protein ACYTFW_00765 [Planctomycetota bacterium]|jgi:hypothetical protein
MKLKYGWVPDVRYDSVDGSYYGAGMMKVLLYQEGDSDKWLPVPTDEYPKNHNEISLKEVDRMNFCLYAIGGIDGENP